MNHNANHNHNHNPTPVLSTYPHVFGQFDDEEDEELAAAVALPWWRRWHWLLALVLPLALSALILAAGITVRILYPQPVRTMLGPGPKLNPCRCTAGGGLLTVTPMQSHRHPRIWWTATQLSRG